MLNVVKKQSIGVSPDRKTAGVRITITRAAEKGIRGNLNIARGLFGNSLLWLPLFHHYHRIECNRNAAEKRAGEKLGLATA